MQETLLAAAKLGTTGKGIGPAYSSKAARNGSYFVFIYDIHARRSCWRSCKYEVRDHLEIEIALFYS